MKVANVKNDLGYQSRHICGQKQGMATTVSIKSLGCYPGCHKMALHNTFPNMLPNLVLMLTPPPPPPGFHFLFSRSGFPSSLSVLLHGETEVWGCDLIPSKPHSDKDGSKAPSQTCGLPCVLPAGVPSMALGRTIAPRPGSLPPDSQVSSTAGDEKG